MDYEVIFKVSVTADKPEEAARYALNDLRDRTVFPWNADVQDDAGSKQTVSVGHEPEEDAEEQPYWFDLDAYKTKASWDACKGADERLDGYTVQRNAEREANAECFADYYQVTVRVFGDHPDHESGEVLYSRFTRV